jgi:DNA (cytosine-5)-methyltransferase 1
MASSVGLFAGIGGMELGMRSVGYEPELLCEILPEAQAVLKARFAGVDLRPDVRALRSLPSTTSLLCGGFPCQDLSSSGGKAGIHGLRSSLVAEVFRLLKRKRVEWVLLENVRFMLHLNRGDAMRQITAAFEELGYRWAYRVLDSQDFGVPQRRERVYLLASKSNDPSQVMFRDRVETRFESVRPTDVSRPIGFYWTEGAFASGLALDAIPPLKSGSTIGIPSPPAIVFPTGFVGTPDIRDAERLQGFRPNWTAAAERVAKSSSRWKLVGNAVTVNVCQWIAKGLVSPGGTFVDDRKLHDLSYWPPAAFGEKGKVWTVSGLYGPSNRVPLSTFLRYGSQGLSKRAVEGFLKRARSGRLRYPEGFLELLTAYGKTL